MSVDHCTRVFEQILDEDGAVSMETTAKKLMAQARQEGREEGRALGEARGEARGAAAGRRQLLEHQLRRRFGKLSKRFVARLNAATDSQLDAIGLRLLDAASIDDAFAI